MNPLLFPLYARLLAAFLITSLAAQEPATTAVTAPAKPAPSDRQISLQFQGGSLEQFVGAVRQKYPDVNIIVNELAHDVKVPAVTVVDVGIEAVLQAVAGAGSERYRLGLATQQTSGNPVYSIGILPLGQAALGGAAQATRSEVRVLSLRKLTEKHPFDPKAHPIALAPAVILSAIEHGSKGMLEAPKMRFHEDTGLLFVQGAQQQQELVRQVLQNLEKDQDMLRNANREQMQIEAQKERNARAAEQRKAEEQAATSAKEGKQGDR
jgi:hypothetical protein